MAPSTHSPRPGQVYSKAEKTQILQNIRRRIDQHLRNVTDPHIQQAIEQDPFYFIIPVQASIAKFLGLNPETISTEELYSALLWQWTNESPETLDDNRMLLGVLQGDRTMVDAAVLKVVMVYQKLHPEPFAEINRDTALSKTAQLLLGLYALICVLLVTVIIKYILYVTAWYGN